MGLTDVGLWPHLSQSNPDLCYVPADMDPETIGESLQVSQNAIVCRLLLCNRAAFFYKNIAHAYL